MKTTEIQEASQGTSISGAFTTSAMLPQFSRAESLVSGCVSDIATSGDRTPADQSGGGGCGLSCASLGETAVEMHSARKHKSSVLDGWTSEQSNTSFVKKAEDCMNSVVQLSLPNCAGP